MNSLHLDSLFLNTRGHDWSLVIPSAYNEAEKHIWVSLQDADEKLPRSVPDKSDIILILDTSFSTFQTIRRDGRPECCLVIKKRCSPEQNVTQVSYICPVLWGVGVSGRKHQFTDAENGKMLGTNFPDILTVSNIANWDHMEPRRNLYMPETFGSRVKLTLTLTFRIATVCILIILSILNIIQLAGNLRSYTIVTSILALEGVIYSISRWAADTCIRRANDYLQLQSFQPDWTVHEPVLHRLGMALSELDGGISP